MMLSGPSLPPPTPTRAWLTGWIRNALRFLCIICSSRAYSEALGRQAEAEGKDAEAGINSHDAKFARALDRKFWGAFIAVILGGITAVALSLCFDVSKVVATALQLGGAGLGLVAAVGIPKSDAWDIPPAEVAAQAGTEMLLFLAFTAGAYGTLVGSS
ncbi:hypothetical protein FXN63_07285 [Pigmentiphaga aceris]|uniref:Uncharacterized protein n=1 Tax=Pigmentiphaga aceris TaxID=1940612 RepID=A0A5C0AVN7_9BURK|nr:hypothetical protein [Pigmentiphaga aceris]QEI05664.1 hypothetical protein FXN63_07285 [Pigmentiphaga aceris]